MKEEWRESLLVSLSSLMLGSVDRSKAKWYLH
jgi:hypothetical protein